MKEKRQIWVQKQANGANSTDSMMRNIWLNYPDLERFGK
jgi:hypothetical protein